mgnify:CR=1 FL=1
MKTVIIKSVKSVYFWLFLLAAVNLAIAFLFVRYPLSLNGDAPSYLNAMRIIEGKDYDHFAYGDQTEIMLKTRILTTPLMLYSSILLSYLTGSEYGAMLVVNIIFYFLIIFVFYQLVYAIYKNRLVAFLSAVLFFGNYGLYNYGVTYRTDLGGWFFFLLSSLFAVRYFKDPAKQKFFYFSVLASAVGVLFKEYGALGLTVLVILILFLSLRLLDKIKKISKAILLFSVLPILYYLFVYLQFHFSYLDRYQYALVETIGENADAGINWSVILLVKVLGWLFLAGWPIFFYGLYQEHKNFNRERFKILVSMLPASLSFLAWPGLTQRIAFVFVPLLAMISGFGLSKLKNKYIIALILVAYLLVNYLIRNMSVTDLMHLINF